MELDPLFVERDACRKSGKPVEIAVTRRLRIRETVLEDVPELYRIWREPGMGDYVQPMQRTLEEELEFMYAYIRHMYAFYDFGLWTVLENGSGKIVGRAGLFPSEHLEDAVELGYMIAPEFQRRGYAAECGRAVLMYAEQQLDLGEVHLLTDRRNRASVRTAESLGFVRKEIQRYRKKEILHFVWRADR